MKKIFYLSHLSNVGGAELTLLDIALELKRKKYDVTIGLPDLKGDLYRYLDYYQIDYIVTNLPIFRDGDNSKIEISDFTNIISELKFKIHKKQINLIMSNTSTIPWGAIISAEMLIPHAWIIRESHPFDHNLSYSNGEICTPKYILKYSDRVYLPSKQSGRNWFGEQFELNQKLGILYTRPLNDRIQDLSIYKKNFFKKELTIGLVTSLEEYKNVKFLYSIIKNWNSTDCGLVIFGTGSKKYELSELIKKYDKNLVIEYKGHCQDLSQVYNLIDINLSLNQNEAFGRTLSEGAFFGCIPMYPSTSSFNERFENLVTGIAFDPLTIETFFKVVDKLQLNRILLEKISNQVQNLAHSGFNVDSPATIIENDFFIDGD